MGLGAQYLPCPRCRHNTLCHCKRISSAQWHSHLLKNSSDNCFWTTKIHQFLFVGSYWFIQIWIDKLAIFERIFNSCLHLCPSIMEIWKAFVGLFGYLHWYSNSNPQIHSFVLWGKIRTWLLTITNIYCFRNVISCSISQSHTDNCTCQWKTPQPNEAKIHESQRLWWSVMS